MARRRDALIALGIPVRLGFAARCALLLALVAASGPVSAGAGAPLSVDQAFKPRATRTDARHVAVIWHIAPGYYLYRHALAFHLTQAGDSALGAPAIPAGRVHHDAYFGRVETYRHRLRVVVPVKGTLPPSAHLRVRYQGCADAGLCYPPQQTTLALHGTAQTGRQRSSAGSPDRAPTHRLAQQIADAGLASTVGLFFLLGLGLAFTPCVLPMIPIVAGLLGSARQNHRRTVVAAVAYVLAMASAYGVFGIVAGYFGANIRAALQRPAVLLPFAGLFALLAAASFGWFDLKTPSAFRARVDRLARHGTGWPGAALLGFSAALIAGPCLAPPLAGALLYISTSGNVVIGGTALFALGLGMGLPLLALAVFGSRILPRRGPWMEQIRVFFGVLLFAVGLWLALRLAPANVGLAAWGALALAYGAYLSTLAPTGRGIRSVQRVAVAALVGYAGLAAAGLAIGGGRSIDPLAGLRAAGYPANTSARIDDGWAHVTQADRLQTALDAARRAHKPAMVDFYADWCVDCVAMKRGLFATPAARRALRGVRAIEFDVTRNSPGQRALMNQWQVFGPPTLVFFNARGRRITRDRLTGRVDADTLRARIRTLRR